VTEKATLAGQPGKREQLTKFACLDCRRVFKRPVAHTGKRNWPRPVEVRRCPSCRGDAYLMSSDFKAPPRDDLKRWEVVSYLVRSGMPYFRIYEPVPLAVVHGHPKARPKGVTAALREAGPYPETMAEAIAFAARYRSQAQPIVWSDD